MCFFKVYFKPSHRCTERELESSAKTKGFHSVTHPSPSLSASLHPFGKSSKQKDSIFGIIFTHLFMSKEGESSNEGSNDSVFGDSCQRGRKYLAQSKRTAPPPNFKNDFQLEISNWYPIEVQRGR
jgi:hypothetical protein